MRKVIISIAIAILILAGIALVVMYNMGDRIIEEAIKNELLSEAAPDTGKAPEAQDEGGTEKTEQGKNEGASNSAPDNNSSGNGIPESDNSGGASGPAAGGDKTAKPGETGGVEKPTAGGKAPEAKPKPAEEPVLTPEKIEQIKDEVSAADKISAAALVLKRLSSEDIKVLKDMLDNGLSGADREKAKALAYSRFTEEEIEKIKEMYEKYMK